jgi:hypothetical protein
MNDPETLRCHVDDDTATVIVDAAEILGIVRGYRGPFLNDPAVRLHLLASLHRQLRLDLLDTACDARELGYTSNELLIILTPDTAATR